MTVEVLLDPPRHRPLGSIDDEIISRASDTKLLSDREVRFMTCDNGQGTRARAAGLIVVQVAREMDPEDVGGRR